MEVFTHVCLSSLKKMSKNFFLDIFCLKKNFLSKKKKKNQTRKLFSDKTTSLSLLDEDTFLFSFS